MQNLENLGLIEINQKELITIDGGNHGYLWSSGGSGGSSDVDIVSEVVELVSETVDTVVNVLEDAWGSIFN